MDKKGIERNLVIGLLLGIILLVVMIVWLIDQKGMLEEGVIYLKALFRIM